MYFFKEFRQSIVLWLIFAHTHTHTHMQDVFAALIRIANARYWSLLICTSGRLGNQCAAGSGALVPGYLSGCPITVSAGTPGPTAAAWRSLLSEAVPCSAACAAGMQEFVATTGCCSATANFAQAEWLAAVGVNPWLGKHFLVQWPSGSIEEFLVPSPCGAGGAADVACGASACGLQWPSPCCDTLVCTNGGEKEYPSACFCSCPPAWTGANCSRHAAHVWASLIVSGLTRSDFETHASGPLLGIIVSAATPSGTPTHSILVELDTVTQDPVQSRRQGSSDSINDELQLNLILRLIIVNPIASVGQDTLALQAAVQLQQAVDTDLLGRQVAIAGLGHAVSMGHPPQVYDSEGNRLCETLFFPCDVTVSSPVAGSSAIASNSSLSEGRGGESGEEGTDTLAAGAAAMCSVLVIAGAVLLHCKRKQIFCFGGHHTVTGPSLFRKARPVNATSQARQPNVVSAQLVFVDPTISNDARSTGIFDKDSVITGAQSTAYAASDPVLDQMAAARSRTPITAVWSPLRLPEDAWTIPLPKSPASTIPPTVNNPNHPEHSKIVQLFIEASRQLPREKNRESPEANWHGLYSWPQAPPPTPRFTLQIQQPLSLRLGGAMAKKSDIIPPLRVPSPHLPVQLTPRSLDDSAFTARSDLEIKLRQSSSLYSLSPRANLLALKAKGCKKVGLLKHGPE